MSDIKNNCYLKTVLGDSLMLLKDLTTQEVDLVLADPPYGNIVSDQYDKLSSEDLLLILKEIAQHSMGVLKDGGSLILFGGIGKYRSRPLFKFLSEAEDFENLYIRDIITWKKNKGYGAATRYLFTREEIIWITKGPDPAYFDKPYLEEKHSAATKAMLERAEYKPHSDRKRRSNVWTDVKEIMRNKLVSAQKPIELYDILIETHCPEQGNIIDMFGGSGNAAISANKNNRNIIIIERDKEVYKLMVNNIEKGLK